MPPGRYRTASCPLPAGTGADQPRWPGTRKRPAPVTPKNCAPVGVLGRVTIRPISYALVGLLTLLAYRAEALPGTHAPAISTYDTRASSIVFAYRHGQSDSGPFNTFSYNANFSSTTGKLSAQFGLHYVNYAPTNGDSKAHGIGASGVGLFVFPVAGRYDDGVPKAAISFDLGLVPTAYVSGQRNFLTLPLVLGFGVPLSPARQVTITPWVEIAPSVNLDTVFHAADITVDPNSVAYDPQTGKVSLSSSAVQSAVQKGVTVDFGLAVPVRSGLEVAFHLSPGADLNLYSSLGALGGGFSGDSVFTVGGGLVIRWDDVVAAVLPVERRLDREGCDAIEGRFRTCPNSRRWISPEQRSSGAPTAPGSQPGSAAAPRTQPLPAPAAAPMPKAAPLPALTPTPAPPAAPPALPSTGAAPPRSPPSPPSAVFPSTN